jgi:hypothetical protein
MPSRRIHCAGSGWWVRRSAELVVTVLVRQADTALVFAALSVGTAAGAAMASALAGDTSVGGPADVCDTRRPASWSVRSSRWRRRSPSRW